MVVKVDCPTCGRKVPFTPESRWRPFCSERCKSVDLGAWASERYRISGDARDDAASSDEGEAGRYEGRKPPE
ncbi:MAG TPA: DNA gyrase inhibitor YacG [Burkholderiaceae bacterium]|nr:DNA gyrase inhibitor YacG [Burkholderiaceae bacterium]